MANGKMPQWAWFLIAGVAIYFIVTSMTPVPPVGDGGGNDGCQYSPTLSVSAKDKFASTMVSGTPYYKTNGLPATTTVVTSINKDETYKYWMSNTSTYYVEPVTKTAGCGVTTLVATGWANGSVSVSGYDLVNRQATTSGVYNTSMGANDQANEEFTYQGSSKQSGMPFGGVMVVEYNATIASATCTGVDISEANDFHVTYSSSATANTFRIWKVLPTIDDGTGSVRTIDCQFKNGAASVAGGTYYVKFIPANYYLTNTGDIVLDVEQNANQATTRTGIGQVTFTGYWGA